MNAVSVCDGISAAAVACAGLDYKFLLLAEIDKFPRAVLRHRHGAVDQRRYRPEHSIAGRPVLWGDFTALRPRHLRRLHGHADVDVLFGGTPCQSFSVAGKRAGLDDPRGDLSLEFALLAYRLGVRWFLWENVPGVLSSAEGRDFAAILSAFTGRVVEVPRDGWQTAGSIPDAGAGQFGVAWRTFDAQYAGVPQRRRRVFVVGHLGDWRRAAAVLFERHSLSGHVEAGWGQGTICPALTARGAQALDDREAYVDEGAGRLRRLTPREWERLQGFPDDYTKISTTAADGPRYKALGNSWAVPCARWIVERIQAVEMAMEFQQVGPKA